MLRCDEGNSANHRAVICFELVGKADQAQLRDSSQLTHRARRRGVVELGRSDHGRRVRVVMAGNGGG